MSLVRIPSSTGSSSLSLKRLFSKASCFESDADYETSSEGHLHPGPETRPSLCRTRDSGAVVNDDISIMTEVSTELRIEVDGNTKNKENSGKAEETVEPEVEIKLHPSPETNQLVSLVLEPIFSSEIKESCELFLSDSRQTLQSVETKSNLVLTTGHNSSTDLQSVYREKRSCSGTFSHSIEADSVCKFEQNRLGFVEQDKRPKSGDKNMDLENIEAPIAIETNPESPPNLIQLKHEKLNGSYNLKNKLIKKSQIMSQIDNGFAPLRDEMNKIFNQVRDLKKMAFDFDTNYNDVLGLSNTVRSTSFLPSLHNTFSAEYELGSDFYRNRNNNISKTFRSSQERLWFNENLSPHSIRCENYPCFHKKNSPRDFGSCPHGYLNNRVITLENSHLQESFVSNSLCNFHGHRVPRIADNSRHISLSDFPVVHQNLHSFHANVLPVNSENLHRHCRSTIPTSLETSDYKIHTASKTVSFRSSHCVADAGKQAKICHSGHQNFESRKESQENFLKKREEKRSKKPNSRESPRNRPKHFSGRRRCKRHCSNLHRQVGNKVSSADTSVNERIPSKLINISMDLENLPLSKNCDTSKETLSRLGGLSQLITELTLITKEIVHTERSGKQLKSDLEFVEVPSFHSGNTIKSEIKCSKKYSDDKEELELSNCVKPSVEKVVAIESLQQQTSTSDLVRKKSSSILSYCSHISRPHTGYEGRPVQVHNYHDKASNTENIDQEEYRKKDLINLETSKLEKPALNTMKDIMKESLTEILKAGVSERSSRKSISNQHLKMSIPKTHERITIVPIIFSSGVPESQNENFDFASSQRSGNNDKKRIPLNPDSDGRSSATDSDFSLPTQAESLATVITHLAQKCAFIRDSRSSINNGMILNSECSSYSFSKPLGSPTKIKRSTKASNESKTMETSSRSSMSYQTSLNPVRNSVSVRRIRGIRTSPEDFMYE